MKHLKVLILFSLLLVLVACGGPGAEESASQPEQADSPLVSDAQDLVGTWRGRPAGGLLRIDAGLETMFAQNLADLEGETILPTMYRGSIRLDGQTVFFEDARCEAEGAGRYEVYSTEDGGIRFVVVEDGCDERVANLLGQRVEPQIDITWYPTGE